MIKGSAQVQEAIDRILHTLIKEYQPQKVVLFGSHAYGQPGPDSDIDLLIVKETNERFIDRLVRVRKLLLGTHRSIPLEAVVLTPSELAERQEIGDQYIAEILTKGVLLYAA